MCSFHNEYSLWNDHITNKKQKHMSACQISGLFSSVSSIPQLASLDPFLIFDYLNTSEYIQKLSVVDEKHVTRWVSSINPPPTLHIQSLSLFWGLYMDNYVKCPER